MFLTKLVKVNNELHYNGTANMTSKMENKIWNWIYTERGQHPDDLAINWESPETIKASLVKENIDIDGFPTNDGVEWNWSRYCKEVATHSMLTDKDFAFERALECPAVKKFWKNCDEPNMPQNQDELMTYVKELGYKLTL